MKKIMTRKQFRESCDEDFDRYYERLKMQFAHDSGMHIRLRDNEDGSETIEVIIDDRFDWNDDVVSGRIPLDEDSHLLEVIDMLDSIATDKGWEFDFELATDIETPIDGGAGNDYLARLTLTCRCDEPEDFYESARKPRKVVKESVKNTVKLTGSFKIYADSIGDAITQLHEALLNADAAITDGNEGPNPEIVKKYNYWSDPDRNGSDVQFTIFNDKNNNYVDVETI